MNARLPALRPARIFPLLGLACTGAATAQGVVTTVPILSIRPVVTITMPTEEGVVYQMQSSSNLQAWNNVGQLIFGNGSSLEQRMSGGSTQFFRLQAINQPKMGSAPWSLNGQSFQLNDGTRTGRYFFAANGDTGTWDSGSLNKTFTWTWQRPGMDDGTAELTYPDGSRDVLAFHFLAGTLGHFTRASFSPARPEGTCSGSFGPVAPANLPGPLAPNAVSGRSLILAALPDGSVLNFTGNNGGTRTFEGQTLPFTGNWLTTGSTSARLLINFTPTHGEDYTFAFTGPLTGRYTRNTFTESTFRDTDEGTFCMTPP